MSDMLIDIIKIGDVVTLKTTTGDELIASYRGEDQHHYKVSKIRALGHGDNGFILMPYLFSVNLDEQIKLNKNLVIAIVRTDKLFADNYTTQTSSLVI